MSKIILATSSSHKIKAFGSLGLDFISQGSEIDECFDGRPDLPEELVLCLAKLKVEAVARDHDSGIVIGFDSVGLYDGKIIEKPSSEEEVRQRLKMLSGKTYQFHTGVYMRDLKGGGHIERAVTTNVEMREIASDEIEKYINEG